jgi:hypothetical protein
MLDMTTLAAFCLFGSITMASGKTENVLVGKVTEIDAQAHTIVIQAESVAKTLPFNDRTRLIGLRPGSKVKDLLPGDTVIALYSEEGGEKQTQEIKNIELRRKIEALEGNVTHVYRLTRLMFIKMTDGKEDVLHISENAALILNGQLTSLAELAAERGEWVKVYYTTDLGLKTVQAMEGQQHLAPMKSEGGSANLLNDSTPTNFSFEWENF